MTEIVSYPMKLRVNMKTAVEYVPLRLPFKSRKVMGDWWVMHNSPPNVKCYAVISENTKTLFLWDDDCQQWFENIDRHFDNQRTGYHRTKLRPQGVELVPLTTNEIEMVMFVGYRHLTKARMGLAKASVQHGNITFGYGGERIRMLPTMKRNTP